MKGFGYVVLGLTLLALLSGCTDAAAPVAPPSVKSDPTPQSLPPPPRSPFTGLPTDLAAPVLAVKIDNVAPARPQTGITAADLVYVEPVEGGLTRLLAVFQSWIHPVIGPVRSARETDLQLLACLNSPALAYSGEAPELRPLLVGAPMVDVSMSAVPAAYYRERGRRSPHNLYVRTAALGVGQPPRDIGFRFGPLPVGARTMAHFTAQYRSTSISIDWVAPERRWVFGVDGAPLLATEGGRPGAATVVLQQVAVRDTAIRDVAGSPSPFVESVGTGAAVVLRDGQAIEGTWSRS
ncbi:MAG: DUF3048 domain-containing protein, partial [Actinomycetota bacterium]|nr:DUF3048 domain-containing protein [Actinomycetota bacterium]